jgi:hypothetical protein
MQTKTKKQPAAKTAPLKVSQRFINELNSKDRSTYKEAYKRIVKCKENEAQIFAYSIGDGKWTFQLFKDLSLSRGYFWWYYKLKKVTVKNKKSVPAISEDVRKRVKAGVDRIVKPNDPYRKEINKDLTREILSKLGAIAPVPKAVEKAVKKKLDAKGPQFMMRQARELKAAHRITDTPPIWAMKKKIFNDRLQQVIANFNLLEAQVHILIMQLIRVSPGRAIDISRIKNRFTINPRIKLLFLNEEGLHYRIEGMMHVGTANNVTPMSEVKLETKIDILNQIKYKPKKAKKK